ncbi:MAG: calcium-translocating P-type ATPase, PMCA-type [Clostridia bacterium]|nr:calcium-translocating P-type ATPase, PMCA-type [Clostridia bacterium]
MDRAYRGLTAEEIVRSREKYGNNEITKHKTKGFWAHFVGELGDPMIKILIFALVINLSLTIAHGGSLSESAGIVFSILAATLVSTASGYKAEKALEALGSANENVTVRVIRDGGVCELPAKDLVVGDTVLLGSGEAVPADGMLFEGRLSLDQSALNGESKEKTKIPGNGNLDPDDPHALLRGTLVSSGEGKMRVLQVGDSTLYGRIAGELAHPAEENSPLKKRLSRLSKQISRIGYVAALLVGVTDIVNAFFISGNAAAMSPSGIVSELLHALTLAVTVIVVAVPEGLPMMISVVLSSNMFRMARDSVMVRRPIGIETAGNMNLLFCDKTGTLTRGKLKVEGFYTADNEKYTSVSSVPEPLGTRLTLSLRLNNEAVWSKGEPIGSNSSDRSLLAFAGNKHIGRYIIKSHTPFDSAKKYSSVTLSGKDPITLVKGAPEVILSKCTAMYSKGKIVPINHTKLSRIYTGLAQRSIRVIALAVTEKGVCSFLGFVGLFDGLRRETPSCIERLKRAGVRVIMLTGDSRETALAVAKQCGIVGENEDGVIDSARLASMNDGEAKAFLPKLRVLARALPSDKSRLVRLADECGLVCGMTGDGTNDAPALKAAHIGFAMGSGSEVARRAGDVVILDDNISSIVKALLYGRTIFHSIRKFIVFQLTMNFCAVGISLAAPFLGIETPITVTQMLWINIIMDTLAGLAFAGEPPREEYLKEAPRRREEGVLCRPMISQILCSGIWTVAASLFFLTSPAVSLRYSSQAALMCGFFCFFVFSGIFNSFNARTERLNLLSRLAANKAFILIMTGVALIQIAMAYLGGSVFRCVPLNKDEITFSLLCAATVIPIDLIRKVAQKLSAKK